MKLNRPQHWLLLALGACTADKDRPELDDTASEADSDTDSVSDTDSDSHADGDTDTDTGGEFSDAGDLSRIDGTAWLLHLDDPTIVGVGDLDGDGLGELAIGEPTSDEHNAGSGSTKIYRGSRLAAGGTLDSVSDADLYLEALGYQEGSGAGLAPAGDVDGDGLSDLIMVAESCWCNGYERYAATLGLWTGLDWDAGSMRTDSADWTVDLGEAQGAIRLASGRDLNADGIPDSLVGMPLDDGPDDAAHDSGGVAVILGPPSTVDGWWSGGEGDNVGESVAMAPDLDGDGYDDAVLGTAQWTGSGPGGAAVLSGEQAAQSARLGAAPWRLESTGTQFAGFRVAALDDIDGDGRGELLVAAISEDSGDPSDHLALFLSPELDGRTVSWTDASVTLPLELSSTRASSLSMQAISATPDGEHSGVLIGRPLSEAAGVVGLIPASALLDGTGTFVFSWTGDTSNDALGSELTPLGDVDGDGFTDFAVSAPGDPSVGSVRVYGTTQ